MAYLSGEVPQQRYPIVWADRDGVTTPLWDRPGTFLDPNLSPDGTRLAVCAVGEEGLDLWLYDLERRTATQLTFDSFVDIYPVWSPDGEYLAWSSSRDGASDVYRMRADSSGETERLTVSDTVVRRYEDIRGLIEGCDIAGATAFLDFAAGSDVHMFI